MVRESCEAFFLFVYTTNERYAETVKPFLFVYLFFITFEKYAEAVMPFLFV